MQSTLALFRGIGFEWICIKARHIVCACWRQILVLLFYMPLMQDPMSLNTTTVKRVFMCVAVDLHCFVHGMQSLSTASLLNFSVIFEHLDLMMQHVCGLQWVSAKCRVVEAQCTLFFGTLGRFRISEFQYSKSR